MIIKKECKIQTKAFGDWSRQVSLLYVKIHFKKSNKMISFFSYMYKIATTVTLN